MEQDGKKRKRLSNGKPTPNKKPAARPASSDRVEISMGDAIGLPPVLLSSPGLVTPKIPFQAYTKRLSARHGDDSKPNPTTHDFLLQSSDHPRLDYSASSISLDRALTHYVALFDPTTNQLQLTPAHSLSLRSTLRSEPKDEDEKKRTYGEQRAELNREFGTKKAKKALDARTLNAITSNTNGRSSVEDVILDSMAGSGAAVLNEQEQLVAELATKPMPKPDLTAKEAKDVYPLDVLMPPSDARLISITEWQKSARGNKEIILSHRFPAFRIATLGKGDDVQRLKALGYLLLLLQFHDALQSAGRSGKKVPKNKVLYEKLSAWPEGLVDSVRRRFANDANEFPKWNSDNLYTHMCALTLFIDGWTTDVTHLRDDLKMRENKEIVRYFRELGCAVSGPTEKERESLNGWTAAKPMPKTVASVTRVAKLKMPPDFPRARVGRKR